MSVGRFGENPPENASLFAAGELSKSQYLRYEFMRQDSQASYRTFFHVYLDGSIGLRAVMLDFTTFLDSLRFSSLAGILCGDDLSPDGLDKMMAVNYVGHFLLSKILLPKMTATPDGLRRIINITCGGFTTGNLHLLFDMQRKELGDGERRNMTT